MIRYQVISGQGTQKIIMNKKAQAKSLKTLQINLEKKQKELEIANNALKQKNLEIEAQNKKLLAIELELEEKKKELALNSKYKSEFLANMSHELRTPLNCILTLAGMLSDNEDGNLLAEQIEQTQVIYNSGQDLLNIINDILDLSKIEAGKTNIYVEKVLLSEVSAILNRHFIPIAKKKNINFQVNIISTVNFPDNIETDIQKLVQILKNLVANAFKFTHQGSVIVNIHRPEKNEWLTKIGLNADYTVAFSVTDTGIGIAPEQQKEIFKAFQQADGTANRRYGGTGLGLSISKGLTRLLGGAIELKSDLNKGSTFTLYLPQTKKQMLKNSPNSEIPLDGKKVLTVEGNIRNVFSPSHF